MIKRLKLLGEEEEEEEEYHHNSLWETRILAPGDRFVCL